MTARPLGQALGSTVARPVARAGASSSSVTTLQKFLDAAVYSDTLRSGVPVLVDDAGSNSVAVETPCVTLASSRYAAISSRVTSGALTALTGAAWIKHSGSASAEVFFGEWNGASGLIFVFYKNASNQLELAISGNGTASQYVVRTTATVADGNWHHVAFAIDLTGDTIVFTIDGQSQSTTNVTGTIATVASMANATSIFEVGRQNAASYFTGQIADCRVWSVAKSTSALALVYAGADDTTSLSAHYPMQEGANTTLFDIGSSAKHLTLSSSAVWDNRTAYVRDRMIFTGGRITQVAIPKRHGASVAANGGVLTHAAGKHSNTKSRVVPNYFSNAQLTAIGYTSAVKLAPVDAVDTISTANTKFRRYDFYGADKYIAYSAASTDSTRTNPWGYLFPFFQSSSETLHLAVSSDGLTFYELGAQLYSGVNNTIRDPDLYYLSGTWYLCYTPNSFSASTSLYIAKSTDLINWQTHATIDCSSVGTAAMRIWSPKWFLAPDSTLHIVVAINPDYSPTENFAAYKITATDLAAGTFSAPSLLYSAYDMIDPFLIYENSMFYLWYKNETTKYIEVASSSTLTGTYTRILSGDWAGWGPDLEGQSIIKRGANDYVLYCDAYNIPQQKYATSTALLSGWSALSNLSYTNMNVTTVRHGTPFKI